jgi:FAD/FMN-containing dehydrogenase/Fe-S oxidoreductase
MPEATSAFEERLRREISGNVRFDKISRALYATDASVYEILPLGVVIPRTRDDVIRVVNACRELGVSITARGGGTSQAGQAIGAGIQIDFSKYLNRLVALDPDQKTVTVEPGIVLDELNAFLKPYGLQLPLDISTADRATIGGMIANNSSGTRSVVYGKTLDYVLELTVLLADGSVVKLQPLSPAEFDARSARQDTEGHCYRSVRQLARDHAAEIEARFPKILRHVGGYNLDEFVPGREPFNLARIFVGSEGTLGLVLEATLRVVPLPKAKVVCVVQFDDLLDALAATPAILEHKPSAVELVDRFILDSTRGKTEFEPLRDFIVGDPAAVLFVELMGESPAELPARFNRLEADLRGRGMGTHFHRALEPAAQARIWKLRQAALGLSMSERGDAKAISFVEDTAVAPQRLRDYIARFLEILKEHDTHAGFYAHASVGLLHVRPIVNLKQADGVARFAAIAEKISSLVLEFGGALSGEHGDGLVRSPFQEKMYGPKLYQAFCELKAAFDPQGIFNPGKIVHAAPLTDSLRFGPKYDTREVETTFDFSDFGGAARAAEQCGGVGACRKTLSGTMCPSYMATRDETDSTRGRANALRLAIAGKLGNMGLADPALGPVLDLCLECKACKSECPTGVDLARLKAEFLHQSHRAHGASWRSRFLASAENVAVWGSRLAPLSNWLAGSMPARWLAEQLLGLDRRRTPPRFVRKSFHEWWRGRQQNSPGEAGGDGPAAVLFADTFTNFYEPEILQAVVELAREWGWSLTIPARVCCGRPLISKGFLDEARRQAELVTRALAPLAQKGLPLVFCEPSCYSAVRDDHPHLLRGALQEQSRAVAAACVTFEEWAEKVSQSPLPGSLSATAAAAPPPAHILLHSHCHQKALVGTAPAVRLLSRIQDCAVTDLDSGCCGMAGSFGYEREHYDVSRAIGERRLLPAIRERPANSAVVAAGFSCRHQIAHFTDATPLHPAILLASRWKANRQPADL